MEIREQERSRLRTQPRTYFIAMFFFSSAAASVIHAVGANASPRAMIDEGCELESSLSSKIATLDGGTLRESNLAAGQSDLDELEEQHLRQEITFARAKRHVLKEAVNQLVMSRILAEEAKKSHGTPGSVMASEVAKYWKPVTNEEMDLFYRANAARFNEPRAAESAEIRRYLENHNELQARVEAFSALKRKHGVQMLLGPLRLPVPVGCSPPRGARHALVTIVEFGDFECEYCAAMVAALRKVLKRFPRDVRLYFRNVVLNGAHSRAYPAAEAALCAGERSKFWEMHDALFRRPGQLSNDDLRRRAIAIGLDPKEFDLCVSSQRYRNIIQHDGREAAILGVEGTPTIFVDGVRYTGVQSYRRLVEIIEREVRLGRRFVRAKRE